MLVHLTQPWDDYTASSDAFFKWFAHHPGYEPDLITVMPLWNGPIETYRR